MRLRLLFAYLGTLLILALSACQSPDPLQQSSPDPAPGVGRTTTPYLFTGNPGIRTVFRDDLSGTIEGTIDGQPVSFGPDKAYPVRTKQGYDPYSRKPSFLSVWAQNERYLVTLGFNGPYEAGRTYPNYDPASDNGDRKFEPYIVTAYVRPPANFATREIIDLATPDKQVRITAITPDYIDIEFVFTLKKAGATPERLAIRVKNTLAENQDLRTQSATDPYWDYTGVSRQIEEWGVPITGVTNYPAPPTLTRVRILQTQLTKPVSELTYEGKTEQATSQNIYLYQTKQNPSQTNVEYSIGFGGNTSGWKAMEINWTDFTGVGIYSGDQVQLRLLNDQGKVTSWLVRPNLASRPTTKWQVEVQRVTPDLIEGTYTIVDAPVYQNYGTAAAPAAVSVSGRFKVIYPR